MRRTGLQRKSPLRRTRPAKDDSAARKAWVEPQKGYCQCGCDPPSFSMWLQRHHIVELQRCKREGAPLYDLENSILLHPHHHERHTSASRRIPLEAIPEAAVRFAMNWLGEGPAANYFEIYYGCQRRRAA